MKYILLLFFMALHFCIAAQNTFYKQFSGKILDKSVRVELIKAPSKDNDFNLRGTYYYDKIGKIIYLNNGSIDATGNFYLEEGFFKGDGFAEQQSVFIKSGSFSGTYYADKGMIEGTYNNLSSKQSFPFSISENYNNASIPADIIFNDLNYESSSIRFHYPKFKNHHSASKINQYIKEKLLGDMPAKMNQFITTYQEALDLGGMVDGYESSNIAYIIHNEENLLALQYNIANYTGESHGVYKSDFFNFNLKNGEVVKLEDIFIKGFEAELTQKTEQFLRLNYGVKPNQTLSEFGFTLPQGKFYLSKNFYLKREGIGFYYNVYEIAPFAVGSQDVFVPYHQIKNLIHKDGLLAKYLK